jgi:hypothetical protein
MPDTKPREPETTAPTTTGDGTPASAPERSGDKTEKQDAPFVWPRDLNAPSTQKPEWGSDPKALRDV